MLKYYNASFLIFLLFYLFLVLVAVPNTELISDRASYFNSFANASDKINNTSFLSLSIIFQEPLYLLTVYTLGIFFSVESIALILIGTSSFMSIGSIFKAKPDLLPLIILIFLLPQFMGKYIVHIRQGVAIAIFLTSYFYFNKSLIKSCFIAGLMHISFFIALPILLMMKLTPKGRSASFIISILLVIFSLFLFSQQLFSELVFYLDLRQAKNYLFTSENVSGLGFIYWIAIYTVFFFQKNVYEPRTFSMNIIGLYCASYFFINFLSRLLESFLPLIFIELKFLNTYICYIALIFYLLISWQTRWQLPMLGFGGG
jgi:hypothetical protein